MEKLLMITLFANTGLLAVLGIVTLPAATGTVFVLQFAGVFQLVLTLPFQVCAFSCVPVNNNKKTNEIENKTEKVLRLQQLFQARIFFCFLVRIVKV